MSPLNEAGKRSYLSSIAIVDTNYQNTLTEAARVYSKASADFGAARLRYWKDLQYAHRARRQAMIEVNREARRAGK